MGVLWCVVVGAGAGPILRVPLFPCCFLLLTPRGSVGRVGAGLLNGFEADGVYWARSTFERNHVQERRSCAHMSDKVKIQACRPYRAVNDTDEISSCIPARKSHQERGPNTSFIFWFALQATRPPGKEKVGTAPEKPPVAQVLGGHRFGEFTVSVTLHEDVSPVSDCLRSDVHRRKNKGEGRCER